MAARGERYSAATVSQSYGFVQRLDLVEGRDQRLLTQTHSIAMAHGLRAQLSPNEELTLRRVALGIALAKDLPVADVLRLRNLALIADRGDRFVLTALGRERYDHLHVRDSGSDDGSKVGSAPRVFAKDNQK